MCPGKGCVEAKAKGVSGTDSVPVSESPHGPKPESASGQLELRSAGAQPRRCCCSTSYETSTLEHETSSKAKRQRSQGQCGVRRQTPVIRTKLLVAVRSSAAFAATSKLLRRPRSACSVLRGNKEASRNLLKTCRLTALLVRQPSCLLSRVGAQPHQQYDCPTSLFLFCTAAKRCRAAPAVSDLNSP